MLKAARSPTLRRRARVTNALADRRGEGDAAWSTTCGCCRRRRRPRTSELAQLVDGSAAVSRRDRRPRGASWRASLDRLPGRARRPPAARSPRRAALAHGARPDGARRCGRPCASSARRSSTCGRCCATARRSCATHLRPLVREATPLVRDLRPSVDDLDAATPRPRSRVRRRPELRRQRAGLQPAGPGGGLPLLDGVVLPQRQLDPVDRGRARASPGAACSSRRLLDARRLEQTAAGCSRTLAAVAAAAVCPRTPRRRARKQMREPGARPAARSLSMVAFALSCFGLLLFLWTSVRRARSRSAARATASTSTSTRRRSSSTHADVRISGVTVGQVRRDAAARRPRRARRSSSSREYAPIPATPRRSCGIKTLLGETYVELTPGSPRRAEAAATAGCCRRRRSSRRSSSTRSCAPSTADTRTRLLRWLVGWSAALRHRGPGPQRRARQPGAGGAGRRRRAARARLPARRGVAAGRTTRASCSARIGARQGALHELISSGDRVLRTTARRDARSPRRVRDPAHVPARAAPDAGRWPSGRPPTPRRWCATCGPARARSRPTLATLSALAPDAEGAVPRRRPADRAVPGRAAGATKVVKGAGPLVEVLYPAGRELVPIVQYLGLYKRELTTSWANIASSTQAVDRVPGQSKPHALRAHAHPVHQRGPRAAGPAAADEPAQPVLRAGRAEQAGGRAGGLRLREHRQRAEHPRDRAGRAATVPGAAADRVPRPAELVPAPHGGRSPRRPGRGPRTRPGRPGRPWP